MKGVSRRGFVTGAVAGLVAGGSTALGQDFGKLFEKAVRDSLQKAISPENVTRMVTPTQASDVKLFPFQTADGWTLVAHRFRPPGPPKPAPALILCHGLTYSAAFWDLEPQVSFARYLASAGWDVWAVDLRGCGMSHKWVFRLENSADALIGGALRRATDGQLMPTGYQSLDPKYANWTLDDHINYDVPAVIRFVQRMSRSSQVAWVGHSMGGIVALGHLSRFANPGISRLATVGSQVTMRDAQLVVPFLTEMLKVRQSQLTGQLDGQQLAAMTQTSVHNLFFNTGHVAPSVYQKLSMDRTDIPAMGLMKQYMTLSSKGELWDAANAFNYAAGVRNVQVPILITCGAVDRFAPPPVQQDLFSRVGSTDKKMIVFGRQQGYAADSGHNDALVGLTTPQQVWPVLARWLAGQPV